MTSTPEKESKRSAQDIVRFYYRTQHSNCLRSSLSLDKVLVELLMIRFGNEKKLRKWISLQASKAYQHDQSNKSISRTVQENAIRLIADPLLFKQMNEEQAKEFEYQWMAFEVFKNGAGKQNQKSLKRL